MPLQITVGVFLNPNLSPHTAKIYDKNRSYCIMEYFFVLSIG